MNFDYKIANSGWYWVLSVGVGIIATYFSESKGVWNLIWGGVLWALFVQIPCGVVIDSLILFKNYRFHLLGLILLLGFVVFYFPQLNNEFFLAKNWYEGVIVVSSISMLCGYVLLGTLLQHLFAKKGF